MILMNETVTNVTLSEIQGWVHITVEVAQLDPKPLTCYLHALLGWVHITMVVAVDVSA